MVTPECLRLLARLEDQVARAIGHLQPTSATTTTSRPIPMLEPANLAGFEQPEPSTPATKSAAEPSSTEPTRDQASEDEGTAFRRPGSIATAPAVAPAAAPATAPATAPVTIPATILATPAIAPVVTLATAPATVPATATATAPATATQNAYCRRCSKAFASRNKLFKHLPTCPQPKGRKPTSLRERQQRLRDPSPPTTGTPSCSRPPPQPTGTQPSTPANEATNLQNPRPNVASSSSQHRVAKPSTCRLCSAKFSLRNQLFKYLQVCRYTYKDSTKPRRQSSHKCTPTSLLAMPRLVSLAGIPMPEASAPGPGQYTWAGSGKPASTLPSVKPSSTTTLYWTARPSVTTLPMPSLDPMIQTLKSIVLAGLFAAKCLSLMGT